MTPFSTAFPTPFPNPKNTRVQPVFYMNKLLPQKNTIRTDLHTKGRIRQIKNEEIIFDGNENIVTVFDLKS